MKISLIQPDILWEDKTANLNSLEEVLLPLQGQTDLVILPEMFSTGFSMNTEKLAEPPEGTTFQWMKKESGKGNFGICGSYIVRSGGHYYNRFVFVAPGSDDFYYDKRHLFSMGDENLYFSAGKARLVFNFMGFRISPYICYDLRFPVWSRNRNEYDLAIYTANWPEVRISVWNTLLKARAIENQCYVAGANRIGTDGTGLIYSGHSAIIDPHGEVIITAEPYKECSVSADLSPDELIRFRNKFPVLNDSDDFRIV